MFVCVRCGTGYEDFTSAEWCKREDDLDRYAEHDTDLRA